MYIYMKRNSNMMDHPILRKVTVNQEHMLMGYIPSLIQVKNETQCN